MRNPMWLVCILAILSILPLVDLLQPGLPLTHDGQDHVARIANFYQSLGEGNIIPRWAGNLNWGYGHPVLMFLYPLPSYVGSLFHFFGFSFVDSTKMVFAVGYIASTLAMYLWGRDQWGKPPAFVAAILYSFAPYRFVDLYVRGAIGEHVAFIWPPLICLGLFHLASGYKRKWGLLVALSTAGLMLSHNAVSLMFAPVIALYMVYLYFVHKRSRIFLIHGSIFLLIGLCLAAFFWIPAVIEGKYTLRDIVTTGDFSTRFVPLVQLFSTKWNYGIGLQLSKEIGFVQWGFILGALLLFARMKNKKDKWFLGGILGIFGVSIFLMLKISEPVWEIVTILQKFQFPWRFLHMTVFCTALLGGIVVYNFEERRKKGASVVVVVLVIVATFMMWHAKDYKEYPESFFTSVYKGTTDTGESSPIWSVRFMEQEADSPLEAIDGDATVTELSKSSTNHRYQIEVSRPTFFVENTLYFPGWKLFVNGQELPIEFQNPSYRGRMTFHLAEGSHTVEVQFLNTKVRLLSEWLSLGGLVVLVITFFSHSLSKVWRVRIPA